MVRFQHRLFRPLGLLWIVLDQNNDLVMSVAIQIKAAWNSTFSTTLVRLAVAKFIKKLTFWKFRGQYISTKTRCWWLFCQGSCCTNIKLRRGRWKEKECLIRIVINGKQTKCGGPSGRRLTKSSAYSCCLSIEFKLYCRF